MWYKLEEIIYKRNLIAIYTINEEMWFWPRLTNYDIRLRRSITYREEFFVVEEGGISGVI